VLSWGKLNVFLPFGPNKKSFVVSLIKVAQGGVRVMMGLLNS
jgi:hypothetical protein